MVSAGLDLGGRGYGVYGVWGSGARVPRVRGGLDRWGGAMVEVVSEGLDVGGRAMGCKEADGVGLGRWGYGFCWSGAGWVWVRC